MKISYQPLFSFTRPLSIPYIINIFWFSTLVQTDVYKNGMVVTVAEIHGKYGKLDWKEMLETFYDRRYEAGVLGCAAAS